MLRAVCFSAILVLTGLGALRGATAADADVPLTHLVGHDVGVCVEITGLSRELPVLRGSQVFQRLQQTPFYERWSNSEDFRKLKDALRFVEKLADRPIARLVDDLFGEHVVFAVYPVADGQPAGVLLMRTAGAAELERALSIWNRLEPCTIETREHAGRPYGCRSRTGQTEKKDGRQYYVKLGRVFALSESEAAIRRVIDLAEAATPPGTTLAEFDAYRQAVDSLGIDHFLRVYLNCRAWDEEIRRQPDPDERFLAAWQQCESLIAGLSLSDGPVLEAVLHVREEGLPAAWQQSLERLAGPTEFMQKVPQRALAAFAGRHDLGGLRNILLMQPSERGRRRLESFRQVSRGMLLGLDLFDDVLPQLKPNWGGYVVPRDELVAGAVPVDGVIAFELPVEPLPASDAIRSRLRDGLDNGLKTALNLLAAWYNLQSPDETAILASESTESGTVWWIEDLGAYRPAYGFTEHYLVLSSSPALIREFAATDRAASFDMLPAFQRNAAARFPQASQVLFGNVAATRAFLRTNWDVLLDQAAEAHSAPRDAVEKRMRHVDALLTLVDTVYLAAQVDRNRLRLILGATAEPEVPSAGGAVENDAAP